MRAVCRLAFGWCSVFFDLIIGGSASVSAIFSLSVDVPVFFAGVVLCSGGANHRCMNCALSLLRGGGGSLVHGPVVRFV